MKIAIFHNFMDNIGGAEIVGLTLARELNADIYTTNIDKSKLNTFADGWRHFRFLLLFSPLFLFFIPGLISFIAGFLTLLWLYFGNPTILGITLYFHPMFYGFNNHF